MPMKTTSQNLQRIIDPHTLNFHNPINISLNWSLKEHGHLKPFQSISITSYGQPALCSLPDTYNWVNLEKHHVAVFVQRIYLVIEANIISVQMGCFVLAVCSLAEKSLFQNNTNFILFSTTTDAKHSTTLKLLMHMFPHLAFNFNKWKWSTCIHLHALKT